MTTRFILIVSVAAAAGCASARQDVIGGHRAATRSASMMAQPGSSSGVVARAEEALTGGARPENWRPALRADLERHLEQIGALGPGEATSPVRSLLNDSSAWLRIAPAAPADSVEGVVMVGPMSAATRAHRVMVVCREAEFDTLDSSVVVCLGDLRARTVRNCVLFVLGRTQADQIDGATICGGGRLDARITRDTTLFAVGGSGPVVR